MAIKFNNTVIPETGTIKYGTTSLTKVIYGTTTVWQKLYPQTDNFGNHDYYARSGSVQEGTFNWDVTMAYEGMLTAVSLTGEGYNNKYTLYGRKTTSDSWTTLASNISPGTTTEISNTGFYKYLRLSTSGYSYAEWVEGAGNYYWLCADTFKALYYHY